MVRAVLYFKMNYFCGSLFMAPARTDFSNMHTFSARLVQTLEPPWQYLALLDDASYADAIR